MSPKTKKKGKKKARNSISVPSRENKHIEFKEMLSPETHLREDKRQHLATQMKYRLDIGKGQAIYIIGVNDDGQTKGLTDFEMEQTMNVLRVIARENRANITKFEKFAENGKSIAKILITKAIQPTKRHIIVATAGHVNHGKSTLVACLMKGQPDKDGKAWLFLDVLPHEIERGLSADLHYALYGFKDGKPMTFKNPLDKKERSRVVAQADKIISFVDTVGHEPWLKTTIRGVVGQSIDYGLLVVAADDGPTHITREHMGLMLAMDYPIVICITKTDRVPKKRLESVEHEVDGLLKNVGRVPYKIKNRGDINVVIDKMDTVVPVIITSATTLKGYDLLNTLLEDLPERKKEIDKPFLMFVDRAYNVTGVGTVVSGTVKQGRLKPGTDLIIGPNGTNEFSRVKAKTIEMHYHRLAEANAGLVVGVALRGIKYEDVKRGMILCDGAIKPRAVKSFESEVLVLSHPTRIANGYEPILHNNTISETVKIALLNKKYLKSGESGRVRMSFRYQPQFVQEGDKFVFREGKTKGIGTVSKILKYA
jgi:elongation factor 1-alpha